MVAKQQHYIGLPENAARAGDPSPDPGVSWCRAYSTAEKDVVVWDGSRWGLAGRAQAPALFALTSLANNSQMQPGTLAGGEDGVSTGFGIVTMLWLRHAPSLFQIYTAKCWSGGGWKCWFDGTNFGADFYESGGGFYNCYMAYASREIGQLMIFVSRITALPGPIEISLNTIWANTGTIPTYRLPVSAWQNIGCDSDFTDGAVDADWLATACFRGVPSRAQLDDYVRAARLGTLPATLAGATITHRWSMRDGLAGRDPVDGQVIDVSLEDTVTGTAADRLTRGGSPKLRKLDVGRLEGRREYGALGFSTASYLTSAVDAGVPGIAGGFHVAVRVSFDALTVPVYQRLAGGRYWALEFGTGSANSIRCFTWAGVGGSMVYVLRAIDLRRPMLLLVHYTGSGIELYVDSATRIGIAAGGLGTQASSPTGLGWDGKDNTKCFTAGTLWGLYGGHFALSAAEITKLYDDETKGYFRGITGKTQHLYDLTQDFSAGYGTAIPTTVLDRIGTDHLTRSGEGLRITTRTNRLWPVESTPINYGVSGFSATNYYVGMRKMAEMPTGPFWFTLVFTPESGAASAIRVLLTTGSASIQGMSIYTSGAHANICVGFTNTGGQSGTSASGGVLSAADINKKVIVTAVYTGTGVYLFHRRLAEATATTLAGTIDVTSQPFYVGSEAPFQTPRPATNTTIHGWAIGRGAPTLAELQAQYDAILATDGEVQEIPGKTVYRHSITLDRDGQAPSTLADKTGTYAMTKVGSLVVVPNYHRVVAA